MPARHRSGGQLVGPQPCHHGYLGPPRVPTARSSTIVSTSPAATYARHRADAQRAGGWQSPPLVRVGGDLRRSEVWAMVESPLWVQRGEGQPSTGSSTSNPPAKPLCLCLHSPNTSSWEHLPKKRSTHVFWGTSQGTEKPLSRPTHAGGHTPQSLSQHHIPSLPPSILLLSCRPCHPRRHRTLTAKHCAAGGST